MSVEMQQSFLLEDSKVVIGLESVQDSLELPLIDTHIPEPVPHLIVRRELYLGALWEFRLEHSEL